MGELPDRSTLNPLRRQWPWLLWTVGLLVWTYLLIVPVDWLPPWFRFGRGTTTVILSWSKLGHVTAYALLMAFPLWLISMRQGQDWVVAVVLSLHAFGTEVVQALVPTRSGSWIDVAIDHVGVVTGFALGRLGDRFWRQLRTINAGPKGVAMAPIAEDGTRSENPQTNPLRNG